MQITTTQKTQITNLFANLANFASITAENSLELNFGKYVKMVNLLKAFSVNTDTFTTLFAEKRKNMTNIDFLFVTLGKSLPSNMNELSVIENGVAVFVVGEIEKPIEKVYAKKELFKYAPAEVAPIETKITLFETVGKGFWDKKRTGLKMGRC